MNSDHIHPYQDHRPKFGDNVFIAPGAQIIGRVEIGDNSNIWHNSVLRGDVNYIEIGKRVNIQDGTIIHVATFGPPTLIGDDVSIGHMALIHACHLQPNSFVGMKAIVMDGAVVESDAMVAAGALVAPGKRVEAGWLWAGVPAKPIRKLTDKDYKMMRWTGPHYVKLAAQHMEGLNL
ncbi:MAG: gamma carbonic anhydrase family protein [Alphaproteobacteria bacterium]